MSDISDDEFDYNLLSKGKEFNMTAKQIKTLLRNVARDEHVLKYALEKNQRDLNPNIEENDKSLIMTRSKIKGYFQNRPQKNILYSDEFFDITEENDPDYIPIKLYNDMTVEMGKRNNNIQDMKQHDEILDENIALRTRSKLDMRSISLRELEGNLLDFDFPIDIDREQKSKIEEDDDLEWLRWLAEFKYEELDTNSVQNQDDDDEDFCYAYDDEKEFYEDEEEFRCDKSVNVTKKEYKQLFSSLKKDGFDLKDNLSSSEYSVDQEPFSESSVSRLPYISEHVKQIIIAQIQQHVQMLVHLYIFGTFYREHYEIADISRYLIQEIHNFNPLNSERTSVNCDLILLFRFSNSQEALRICEFWKSYIDFGCTLVSYKDTSCVTIPERNLRVGLCFVVSDWKNLKFPQLPLRLMSLFINESLFSCYPCLIPTNGLIISQSMMSKINNKNIHEAKYSRLIRDSTLLYPESFQKYPFSSIEDALILLGVFQWKRNWQKIHSNILPVRTTLQIKNRYRKLLSGNYPRSGDLINILTKRGLYEKDFLVTHISDNPVYCFDSTLSSRHTSEDFIPHWLKTIHNRNSWRIVEICPSQIKPPELLQRFLNEMENSFKMSTYVYVPQCSITDYVPYKDKDSISVLPSSSNGHLLPSIQLKSSQMENIIPSIKDINLRAVEILPINLNILSLSNILGNVLSIIIKENFSNDIESYQTFMKYISTFEKSNSMQILTELLGYTKRCPGLFYQLCYIFGVPDPRTRGRFWLEFAQLGKNLKEIELFLSPNSSEFKKIMLFLSNLSSNSLEKLTIEQLRNLLPCEFDLFRGIRFTNSVAVPSFFTMLQNLVEERYVNVCYEAMTNQPVDIDSDGFNKLVLDDRYSPFRSTFVPRDQENKINKDKASKWTKEEDRMILSYCDEHGCKSDSLNYLSKNLSKPSVDIFIRYKELEEMIGKYDDKN